MARLGRAIPAKPRFIRPAARTAGNASFPGAAASATAAAIAGALSATKNPTVAGAVGTATGSAVPGTLSGSGNVTFPGAAGSATAAAVAGTISATRNPNFAGAAGTATAAGIGGSFTTGGTSQPSLSSSQIITGVVANDNGGGSPPLAFTPFMPTVGELLVIKAVEARADASWNLPSSTGGGLTWTQQISDTGSGTGVAIFTASVTTASTVSITITAAGPWNAKGSAVLERWASAQLAATPATVSTNSFGTPSATLTTTGTNSVVTWCAGDDSAVDGTTRTYSNSAVEDGYNHVNSSYTGYYAYQPAASPGAQSIGMSAPTGQTDTVAGLELLAGSGVSGSFAGAAATASASSVAGFFNNPGSVNFNGSPATATAAAPAGTFDVDVTESGSAATATASAIAGSFSAVSSTARDGETGDPYTTAYAAGAPFAETNAGTPYTSPYGAGDISASAFSAGQPVVNWKGTNQ